MRINLPVYLVKAVGLHNQDQRNVLNVNRELMLVQIDHVVLIVLPAFSSHLQVKHLAHFNAQLEVFLVKALGVARIAPPEHFNLLQVNQRVHLVLLVNIHQEEL